MASQLERLKKLWENYKAHHVESFYGIWTRFDPYTGEAFDSHKSQRQFWKEDEAGTRVVQKNSTLTSMKAKTLRFSDLGVLSLTKTIYVIHFITLTSFKMATERLSLRQF